MMKRILAIVLSIVALQGAIRAQELIPVSLDATMCGGMQNLTGSFILEDDNGGANGNYSPNFNCSFSVAAQCSTPYRLGVRVEMLDIDPGDTLYIYDGPTVNPSRLMVATNNSNPILYHTLYSEASSNVMTILFRSNSDNNVGAGFSLLFSCSYPCEMSVPVIEDTYYRVINGTVVGTSTLRDVVEYDTAITVVNGVPETTLVANHLRTVNICEGECIQLQGHGEYTNNTGAYTPSDATTTFRWSFGNQDSLVAVNATRTRSVCYDSASCYYVTLSLIDQMGCSSVSDATMYVRIAPNPIKSIGDLETICANDSMLVSAGFDEYSTVSFNHVNIVNNHSRVNNAKTFIPDGMGRCPTDCYSSVVVFNEFASDQIITSASDICSICVNYEHSYMGDYQLAIECPNGAKSILKYKEQPNGGGAPEGSYGGGGTYTGYPYGGSNDGTWDQIDGSGDASYCDSIYNMYGVGLDYCFSRNADYTLADGYPANTTTSASSHYIANTDNTYKISVTHTFEIIPRPYASAGETCGTSTFMTKRPSKHDTKSDYYLPAQDFSQLIGCPLNGAWKVEICDWLHVDNGWVFSWSMDLCNDETDKYNCHYEVPLDTAYWTVDSTQGDWYRGEYRGLHVYPTGYGDNSAYVSSVDTSGSFRLLLNMIDDYGCHWDTALTVNTNPLPRSVYEVYKCPYEEYTWVNGETYTDAPMPRPTMIYPATTGCDSLVSLQIINDKVPEARINALPSYVTYENPEVTLYDISEGGYSRTWYFDDEIGYGSPETFTYPIDKDSLIVMMIAESKNHCPDTAYVTIPMDKTLIWVPNAFTPDKEDNNLFFVQGHNILDDIQVYIYNRTGALVSSWVGFEGRWDGYHGGKRCGLGAYTWVVKYHSSFEPSRWHYQTGTVTVLR